MRKASYKMSHSILSSRWHVEFGSVNVPLKHAAVHDRCNACAVPRKARRVAFSADAHLAHLRYFRKKFLHGKLWCDLRLANKATQATDSMSSQRWADGSQCSSSGWCCPGKFDVCHSEHHCNTQLQLSGSGVTQLEPFRTFSVWK